MPKLATLLGECAIAKVLVFDSEKDCLLLSPSATAAVFHPLEASGQVRPSCQPADENSRESRVEEESWFLPLRRTSPDSSVPHDNGSCQLTPSGGATVRVGRRVGVSIQSPHWRASVSAAIKGSTQYVHPSLSPGLLHPNWHSVMKSNTGSPAAEHLPASNEAVAPLSSGAARLSHKS